MECYPADRGALLCFGCPEWLFCHLTIILFSGCFVTSPYILLLNFSPLRPSSPLTLHPFPSSLPFLPFTSPLFRLPLLHLLLPSLSPRLPSHPVSISCPLLLPSSPSSPPLFSFPPLLSFSPSASHPSLSSPPFPLLPSSHPPLLHPLLPSPSHPSPSPPILSPPSSHFPHFPPSPF